MEVKLEIVVATSDCNVYMGKEINIPFIDRGVRFFVIPSHNDGMLKIDSMYYCIERGKFVIRCIDERNDMWWLNNAVDWYVMNGCVIEFDEREESEKHAT